MVCILLPPQSSMGQPWMGPAPPPPQAWESSPCPPPPRSVLPLDLLSLVAGRKERVQGWEGSLGAQAGSGAYYFHPPSIGRTLVTRSRLTAREAVCLEEKDLGLVKASPSLATGWKPGSCMKTSNLYRWANHSNFRKVSCRINKPCV